MDVKHRMLLQHHQQDIIKDLDVNYILDELYTKNVISPEEFDHIFSLVSLNTVFHYQADKNKIKSKSLLFNRVCVINIL